MKPVHLFHLSRTLPLSVVLISQDGILETFPLNRQFEIKSDYSNEYTYKNAT